ncbi:Elongation of fatty acids protein 2, partial [Coemansia aciculifera]
YIKEHRSIEEAIKVDKVAKGMPENWPFEQARELFHNADVSDCSTEFVWEKPDTEGMVQFLVQEMEFNEQRVRSAAAKLEKASGKGQQVRIDSFFKVTANRSAPKKEDAKGNSKRKGVVANGSAKRPKK